MMEEEYLLLSELELEESATIISVGNKELAEKVYKMGCFPGEKIVLKRKAPLGDPLMIAVSGYLLGIRKEEARKIIVARVK